MRIPLLLLSLLGLATAVHAEVGIGEPAPPFTLSGSDGTLHSLADSVGKRAVVVAWFPKAFTPG
jgi:peroxiredoxin Q/BCP